MRTYDSNPLRLPPEAVANPAFRHQDRIDAARRFLAARGITEVRPVYGPRARPSPPAPTTVRMGSRPAANDVNSAEDSSRAA
jgi:hypothetical protein